MLHYTKLFPQIQARNLREERDYSFTPTLPPQACWNVTGVMARACPNSRNTCFSP